MRTRKQVRFRSWDDKHKIIIGPWDIGSEASFEWNPDMQFTGMLDKYERQIYEDDIVIVSSEDPYENEVMNLEPERFVTPDQEDLLYRWEFKGRVVFSNFGWVVISEDKGIPFCDIARFSMEIKIIGNSFEGEKNEN